MMKLGLFRPQAEPATAGRRLIRRPRGGQRAKRAHGRERKEPRGDGGTRATFAFFTKRTMRRLQAKLWTPEPAMTEILETPKLVTVFGGSGFIGRHVVRALAKRGYRIRVATRRPELAGHLQPLGNVGQIQPVQANLRVRWSVDRAVEGADHVINLVGILYQSGRADLLGRAGFGARAVAEAAAAVGARLTHGSAIGADAKSQIRLCAHQGARREGGAGNRQGRGRSSGRRSCSAPRTSSSTASPTWRAIRRCCR